MSVYALRLKKGGTQMANTTINDITQMMAAQMANLTNEIGAGSQKVSNGADFAKSLDEATDKITKVDTKSNDSLGYAGGAKVDKSATKEVKGENKDKVDVNSNQEDKKMVADKAAKVASDVKDNIKDTMDVTDEELTNAMEALGLAMQDLLDPKKIQELMMELGGVSDSISLITNAQLYTDVKSVMEFATVEIEGLKNELSISTEDIAMVVNDEELMAEAFVGLSNEQEVEEIDASDDFSSLLAEATSDKKTSDVSDEGNVKTIEVTVTKEPVKTDANSAQSVKTDNSAASLDKATENGTKDLSETESFTSIAKSETDPMKGRNEGFENVSKLSKIDRSLTDGISDASSFVENVTVKTEVNNVGDIVETVTTYSNSDANEILSQVTESIRVNYTEDTTSMELQLHPASLGTVNMQVSATNGIVTAHIIVQDEAVKAALESQLLTLQETFEEQGHKVEAVEVSIANYDLNQGMNRDNSQNESERREKEAIKASGARRRINLSDFADDTEGVEALSEEDKITKDMMERNGNTLDYQA